MWEYEWDSVIENLCRDARNKEKIKDILRSVPDTDLRFPGMKTMEDAIAEIRGLHEDEVANSL